MAQEREGDRVGRRIHGKLTESSSDELQMISPSKNGSGNTVDTVVEKDGVMTRVSRGGVKMIGDFDPEVQKHAIDANAGTKVEVAVKFSDDSQKHKAKYCLNDTAYDIVADIKVYKKISKLCDSVTGIEIHEDTKISTLQKEDRLEKLKAMVDDADVKK